MEHLLKEARRDRGRGSLSGWKFGVDACGCQVEARLQYPLGNPQIHEYATTQRDGSGGHVLVSLIRDRETPEKMCETNLTLPGCLNSRAL